MAAGQATTIISAVLPILHLVFTIVSITVLSYKVYHVESELSFIRDELSTHDRSDGFTKTLPFSTAEPISERSVDSESRSDLTRQRDHRNHEDSAASLPNQKKFERRSTKQNIADADCLQQAIKTFQVSTSHSGLFAMRSCCLFCLACKCGHQKCGNHY